MRLDRVLESSTGTSVNPYRYVGQWGYYDDGAMGSSSGLLLLGVRYYSPAHGRFWSWDPVPTLNLYAYVENSATMAIDPSGEQDKDPKRVAAGRKAWKTTVRRIQERFGRKIGWIGIITAIVECLLDAAESSYETPDDAADVCVGCCRNLALAAGSLVGSVGGSPILGSAVGAGIGFVGGRLLCDGLCCLFFPTAIRCGGYGLWPFEPQPGRSVPVPARISGEPMVG